MKKNSNLFGILLLCLAYRFFYFGFLHPNMILYNSDSVSYFAPINIFNGIIDLYRTPVYPYVLNFFEYLSKENFIRNLFLFQQTISFLSIIPFYFISKNIVKNKYLVIITTIFYGCWHPIIAQNVNINPECLCIVGSTLILFMLVKYLEKPTKHNAIAIGLFPFILIMLKPTYLILLCIVLVFLIVRFTLLREERKILYWGLLGWFVAVAGVLGYCEMNNKYNGDFVLSNIFLNNSLAHISISGAYKHGGDKEFIAIIDATRYKGYYTAPFIINNDCMDKYSRCYKKFPQYLPPTDDMLFCSSIPNTINYSSARLWQFVKKSQHTMIYFKYIISRMIDIMLAYGYLFILFMLETISIIYAFVKYKKIAWAQSLCIFFVVGQFITITIGGLDDIDRCLAPSYPFIIQLIASFFAVLINIIDKKKLIESII